MQSNVRLIYMMKLPLKWSWLFLLIFGISCDDADKTDPIVEDPVDLNTDFNTLGTKWGDSQSFSPFGYNVGGPEIDGGTVSFSFGQAGLILETEIEVGIESVSFSQMVNCAQVEIRNALDSWSEISNIEFSELPTGSESDITFYIAPIKVVGIAAPPLFTGLGGNDISGQVVFRPNQHYTCHKFYLIALHEVGHALGLGHVEEDNIMAGMIPRSSYKGLQAGDIKGIQSIYGKK